MVMALRRGQWCAAPLASSTLTVAVTGSPGPHEPSMLYELKTRASWAGV